MSEKGIQIHKFQDGNEAVVVEFGFGKIGIGLDDNCARNLAVHLQELNEPKDMGAFLTREELEDNFNKPSNPLEVILGFPDVKSIDNFIETLKIYRQKVFFPNARTRSARRHITQNTSSTSERTTRNGTMSRKTNRKTHPQGVGFF